MKRATRRVQLVLKDVFGLPLTKAEAKTLNILRTIEFLHPEIILPAPRGTPTVRVRRALLCYKRAHCDSRVPIVRRARASDELDGLLKRFTRHESAHYYAGVAKLRLTDR